MRGSGPSKLVSKKAWFRAGAFHLHAWHSFLCGEAASPSVGRRWWPWFWQKVGHYFVLCARWRMPLDPLARGHVPAGGRQSHWGCSHLGNLPRDGRATAHGSEPISEQVAYSESELNLSQVLGKYVLLVNGRSRWGLPSLLWQHFQVVKFGSRLEKC